jgi:hypothetical protein
LTDHDLERADLCLSDDEPLAGPCPVLDPQNRATVDDGPRFLLGNVAEWTSTPSEKQSNSRLYFGGSWGTSWLGRWPPKADSGEDRDKYFGSDDLRTPDLGFRCASDPNR